MKTLWNRPAQIYLTSLVALQIIPLLSVVPTWVSVVGVFLVLWKSLELFWGVRVPSPLACSILSGICLAGVYFTEHTLLGEDAATAGLVMISGCKLLETKTYRDVMVGVILCFVLLMTELLASQSFGAMIFIVADVLLITQLMLQLHPSDGSLLSFKTVAKLLLYVLPIWILLFTVFPRFTVGFWKRDTRVSQTGFSDGMDPGSVSRVAQSDEIAFRVHFESKEIKTESLYWRGGILSVTDGLHWMKSTRTLPSLPHRLLNPQTPKTQYQLFLEPYFGRWLFTLDYADPATPLEVRGEIVHRVNGGVDETERPLSARVEYEAAALLNSPVVSALSPAEIQFYSQVPPDLSPKIIALGKSLRAKDKNLDESVANLFRWFQSQKFSYSLDAPSVHDLDRFLFQSKIGFCEHYAAAAATLLRTMGYPARVVIGFQGGEKNEVADFFVVRNRDAHAWSEVWDRSGGYWKRVDLISIIAPLRLAPSGSVGGAVSGEQRLKMVLDSVEMKWVQFTLTYDYNFQKRWITKLGVKDASRLTFFAILAAALSMLFLVFMYWFQRQLQSTDPVLREWQRFCAKLEKNGIAKKSTEGPLDYLDRLREALPSRTAEIERIVTLFIQLRFTKQSSGMDAATVKSFRKLVRQYKG